jgi:thioredoxin reductase
MNTQSKEVIGNMMGVTGLRVQDDSILPLDGVFVAIGSTPITTMIDSLAPEKDSE